jgi:copper transport protein
MSAGVSKRMVSMNRRAVLRRVAGVLLVVPVMLGWWASPAFAHASLVSTTPAQNSQLAVAPSSVSLVFDQEVGVNSGSLTVMDAGGRVVSGAPTHPGGNSSVVQVGLKPALGIGSYTVSWRVVSVDGHPVSGTFAFGVGVPPGTVQQQVTVAPSTASLHSLAVLLSYVGTVLLLGVSVFLFWLWPGCAANTRMSRLAVTAVAVAATGAVLSLLAAGPYVSGRGLGALFDPGLLGETLGTSYGRPLLLRVLAVGLSVPVLGIWPKVPDGEDDSPGGVAAVGNAVLLAASFSFTGHAAEASPRVLAETADAVHLAAAGVWLGGLAVLMVAFLPDADQELRARVLPRWSRVAVAAVTLLAVTGVYQGWRETREIDAATGTTYGRLLLTKVGLFLVLLVLGAFAHRIVATGSTRIARLRHGVETEAVLGIVVLTVTTFLVSSPPAVTAYAPPFTATLTARDSSGQSIRVVVDVAPTKIGAQTVQLRTYDSGTGAVLEFLSATGTLSRQGASTGPVRVTFTSNGDGQARATGVVVPSAGRWTLTVQVVTDLITDYAGATTYTVR